MADITFNSTKGKVKISKVELCSESLTDRAGIAAFARYLEGIGMPKVLAKKVGRLKKSAKGAGVAEILGQIICWMMDGTSSSLSYFDRLKQDESFASVVRTESLVSSHTVKRLCGAFDKKSLLKLHEILDELFVWRLLRDKPECVVLGLDVMPMDNDQAKVREGVKVTYKKCKGFAPLQMTWNRRIVACSLRPGDVHSMGENDAERMIEQAVRLIRNHYSQEVPIVIRLDSGFMSESLFDRMEELDIGYLCGGRKYTDLVHYMSCLPDDAWQRYFNPAKPEDSGMWEFVEYGGKYKTWKRFRRALFARPLSEDGKFLLPFARPCTVTYTNIGRGEAIDEQLQKAGYDHLFQTENLLRAYHDRGNDELVFRGFKELQGERLPFKRFNANQAIYLLRVLTLFLFESFKADISHDVIPITSYANTFRRQFVDTAGKIVFHGGQLILKVSRRAWDMMQFSIIWERCCQTKQMRYG